MTCPVCGFQAKSEDIQEIPPTKEQLIKKRLYDSFRVNHMNSWWLSQPRTVCKWLKDKFVNPKTVLDVGCGDGRWLPGVLESWPDVKYIGIDGIEDHIRLNKEDRPGYDWIHGNFSDYKPNVKIDLVLINGTLNPKMEDEAQDRFMRNVVSISSVWISCLFDLNQTGTPPAIWLRDNYYLNSEFSMPKSECGPFQKSVVWLYGAR